MHKFSNLPGYYPNSYNLLSKPCYIFLNAKVKGKYYYSKMWEFVAICCIPGTISLYKVPLPQRRICVFGILNSGIKLFKYKFKYFVGTNTTTIIDKERGIFIITLKCKRWALLNFYSHDKKNFDI